MESLLLTLNLFSYGKTILCNVIIFQETQYDLIIKDVEPMHSGTYLCQVTATKLYTHYITLTVLGK